MPVARVVVQDIGVERIQHGEVSVVAVAAGVAWVHGSLARRGCMQPGVCVHCLPNRLSIPSEPVPIQFPKPAARALHEQLRPASTSFE